MREIAELMSQSGAAWALAVYSFAARETLERVLDAEGIDLDAAKGG